MAVDTPLRPWPREAGPDAAIAALFDGALLVLRDLPALDRLVDRAQGLVADAFGGDPMGAEARIDGPAHRQTAARLRRAAETDPALNHAWIDLHETLGLTDTYSDRLNLRIMPSRPDARTPRSSPLAPHRDTWGSGLAAQVNWWAPVHPVTAETTMWLWPGHFRTAVANDSSTWRMSELRRWRAEGRLGSYPLLPTATEPVARQSGLPVVLEPGAMLVFSGGHLHASADNGSGRTRFSLDTRTVRAADLRAGLGAPNVDNGNDEPNPDWFAHIATGAALVLG